MQVNATIGGSRPDGRILTEAVGNEAKSGMQINAPIYGRYQLSSPDCESVGTGLKGLAARRLFFDDGSFRPTWAFREDWAMAGIEWYLYNPCLQG